MDHVVNWVLQFDAGDYGIACRVLENLNVLGHEDLERALDVAYSRLCRLANERGTSISGTNTLFAGIGEAGKSGSMIAYHFRLSNEEVSEDNFFDDSNIQEKLEGGSIKNIVLLDDIVGSGLQSSREIEKITQKVLPLGVENIFLLTVCGMKEGLIKVEKDSKAYAFSAMNTKQSTQCCHLTLNSMRESRTTKESWLGIDLSNMENDCILPGLWDSVA